MKKILVIGSLNIDTTFFCDNLPVKGQTISAKQVNITYGGKGANEANVIGSLGGNVAMLGAIGNDQKGKDIVHALKMVSVMTKKIKKVNNVTGSAFINVDQNGDNFIVLVPGANQEMTKLDIDQNINLIKKSDIVMLQLEIPMETVLYAAKVSKSLGKVVFLDPAPATENLPEEIYQYVDYIKPNEKELLIITKNMPGYNGNILNSANLLLQKKVKNVIVSLGEKGAILVNEKGVIQKDAIKVNTIDTTAAGDTFIASFAYCLSQNMNVEKCFDFAMKAAALSTTKKGAFTSAPKIEEVINLGEI